MIPKLLVTTALEQTWGNDVPVVFLGEWCRLYNRRDVWKKRAHQVVHNHWDDRKKLGRDYDYLRALHESLLEDIAQALNNYHQIDRPLRYWRMILNPWLLTYVAVIFDRWECLRLAFEEHDQLETITVDPAPQHRPPFDYNDFNESISRDIWNYQLFLEIIESTYSGQARILRFSSPSFSVASGEADSAFKPNVRPRSLKWKIAAFLDNVVGKLSARNRVVFFQSYFPPAALMRLNLNLKQWPRLYLKAFEWPIPLGDFAASGGAKLVCRDRIFLKKKAGNLFEEFLLKRIVKDIPFVHVEGFSALRTKADQISMRPKVILTAVGQWGNDLFKLWSAERVVMGCKFVVIQHGGSLHTGAAFDFEEDISDYYATPAMPRHPKHIRLPFSKLAGYKTNLAGSFCSLIGQEGARYSCRAQTAPIAGQTLINYRQAIDFYSCLSLEIQRNFRVKPYPDRGWNTRQRFVDDLGAEKVSEEKDYRRFLSQSRVIVCTYPQTTFSEAMASGLPTILLYPDHLWELNPAMYGLLEILMTAKIVFHDPQAAAMHLNAIWAHPDQWWDSPDVISARNEFRRQAAYTGNDWLGEWTTFLEGVIA